MARKRITRKTISLTSNNAKTTNTSTSIDENNEEIKIDIEHFLPQFTPVQLSGENLAQQYVSEFNTGMNIYQCLNYLQGYIGWLVKAVNDVVKKWNKNVEEVLTYCIEITKKITKEEFDKHWAELKPQVIELVKTTTTEQFNYEWSQLKPQVIELVKTTTTEQFNYEWSVLKPQVIELSKQTTIEQWNALKPDVTQYVQTQINNYIDNDDSKIGKMYNSLEKILKNLKNSGAWNQSGSTIFDGSFNSNRNIATGNINIFGGSTDGSSYIRTNSGSTENDLSGGV